MKPLLNQLTKRQPPRNVSHDEPESALLPSLPYSPSSAWPRQGIEHDSTTLRTAASAPHHKTRFDTQELQIPSPSHDSQDSSSWHRHRSWSDESDARIARGEPLRPTLCACVEADGICIHHSRTIPSHESFTRHVFASSGIVDRCEQ